MAAKEAEARPGLPVRPRPTPKQSMQRFIMIFLGITALYVLIFPDIGTTFGQAAGLLLNPLIGFNGQYPVITILIAGLLTTVVSSVLRHFITPWARMAKMNLLLGALRKETMEAVRKGNQSKVEKLRARQREHMAEYADVQFVPMKSMAYTMLLFVVIFTWIRLFVDVALVQQGNLSFAVPWSPTANFLAVYVFPSWILLYSLLAIPFSQVLQRVLKYVSFRKKLQELGVLTELTPPEEAG